MAHRYTETQHAAIQSEAPDICVVAGAGSGKTGILVERFVRLIHDSVTMQLPPERRATTDEIVVATFTNRATREIRGRIVQQLAALGLYDQLRLLDSASITTVHGLCSRILRENTIEAGIDPAFNVIDEAASRRILQQATGQVLTRECLPGQAESEICKLVDACIAANAYQSDLDKLNQLSREAEAILHQIRGAGISRSQLKTILEGGAAELNRRRYAPFYRWLLPTFHEIEAALTSLAGLLNEVPQVIRTAWTLRLRELGPVYTPSYDLSTLKSYLIKLKTIIDSSPPALLRRAIESLRLASDQALQNVNDEMARREETSQIGHGMLQLVHDVWQEYAQAKRIIGAMDSDDLQLECVQLLENNPAIRDNYQRQFKYLLIDELQDTNWLQMRLLRQLHPTIFMQDGQVKEKDVSCNCLFVVGDVRQSIYAFRYAVPALFQELERRVISRAPESALYLRMDENFRSRPEILSLVNQVFATLWRSDAQPFAPLISRRNVTPAKQACVDILMSRDMSRREYVHQESRGLAGRIRAMVVEEKIAEYADVAILLRSTRDVRIYQEALREYGIPTNVATGGRGFYDLTEIQDILNVLTIIAYPLDERALLAALRSPFVDVELDTLYQIVLAAKKMPVTMDGRVRRAPLYIALQHLLQSGEISDTEQAKIAHLISALERLQPLCDRLGAAGIIAALMADSGYELQLISRAKGTFQMANIRKLTEIALEDPDMSLHTFLQQIEETERQADREGSASGVDEGVDAVKLLTIHSAKGLEFPVVVLPDLSRALHMPDTDMFAFDATSIAIGSRLHGTPDPVFRAIVMEREELLRAESIRLLYVAMTRARDHLVLSGNVGRNRGHNWMDLILPALGITDVPEEPVVRKMPGDYEVLLAPLTHYANRT